MNFIKSIFNDGHCNNDGYDLLVKERENGLYEINIHPLSFNEAYYLYTEILDCAHVVVTCFDTEIFDVIQVKDEIESKHLTQLLQQKERLELTVVEKKVSSDEFYKAWENGFDDELFGEFFYLYCSGDSYTTIFSKNPRIVEMTIPYFFRKPYFQTVEKKMKSDMFFIDKIMPYLKQGIHFNPGNVVINPEDEEIEELRVAIGLKYQSPRIPKNWKEQNEEIDSFSYKCEKNGILRFIEDKKITTEEYNHEIGGIDKRFSPVFAKITLFLMIVSIISYFNVKIIYRTPILLFGLLTVTVFAGILITGWKKYSLGKNVRIINKKLTPEGDNKFVQFSVRNDTKRFFDNGHYEVIFRDKEGNAVINHEVYVHTVKPDEEEKVSFNIEDSENRIESFSVISNFEKF